MGRSLLRAGINTIAAEVQYNSVSSSDIYWNDEIVKKVITRSYLCPPTGKVTKTEYFTADGMKLNSPRHGVNIVRRTHSDVKVTTRRIIVK